MSVEGWTGWRYVAEEIIAAGFEVHVAEPADTQSVVATSIGPRPIVPTPGSFASCSGVGELPESWPVMTFATSASLGSNPPPSTVAYPNGYGVPT
jgi:hypothetical protein